MSGTRRLKQQKKGPLRRRQSTLGCPRDHHRATWCQRLCQPQNGRGDCGRLAPHAMVSRFQRAIAAQRAREARGKKRSIG